MQDFKNFPEGGENTLDPAFKARKKTKIKEEEKRMKVGDTGKEKKGKKNGVRQGSPTNSGVVG